MLCERIKMKNPSILAICADEQYALLDSGEGEKLEKYGQFVLSRPDPQALWRKHLPEKEWQKADAIFLRDGRSTEWKIRPGLPPKWPVELGGLKFWVKPTSFKHTGLFPEQSSNWSWLAEVIGVRCHPERSEGSLASKDKDSSSRREVGTQNDSKKPAVLNLFGYTGGATLACAKAGASVCHVDGSKTAITWARENAELSGLADKPVRWILDDAVKFVKREIKRGRKYDGIILDPPAFGHGPAGEMWKIEENFLDLLDDCQKLMSDKPLFFLVNGYSSGYSAIAYENALGDLLEGAPFTSPHPSPYKGEGDRGEIEKGALAIRERDTHRLLPCGIFARWRA